MGEREILTPDLQASPPEVRIGLSRVGVTGVGKAIRLSHAGTEKLIAAEIDCAVDLDPSQKGVHMSRFPELFEEAIEEVVIGEALLVEALAEHIARHIAARQRALRAEVKITARYPLERRTPVTGLATQELVPLATHNQRGRGTLYVGTDRTLNAESLVDIVERSMSSPVYELLKRPDELFVVEHAHLQPRFVEDSVRAALALTLERYPELDDSDFLYSRQVNLETIHTHDVVAERHGTVGELRGELAEGVRLERHTELRDWLSA